jgi:hypothetical protein
MAATALNRNAAGVEDTLAPARFGVGVDCGLVYAAPLQLLLDHLDRGGLHSRAKGRDAIEQVRRFRRIYLGAELGGVEVQHCAVSYNRLRVSGTQASRR